MHLTQNRLNMERDERRRRLLRVHVDACDRYSREIGGESLVVEKQAGQNSRR